MADKFHIAVIAWDQKEGGILEAVQPKLRLTSKTTMNIYNMHRIRRTGPSYGAIRLKLNNGERFNVLTFFTGYGASTSPDGFTGNYGCEFGVAERVLAIFLPMDVKSSEYEEIIARLGSRIFLEEEGIEDRLKICGKLVKNSGAIKNPDGIFKILEDHLDRKLGLSTEDKCLAFEYEAKALRYLLEEKLDTIKDLRINPAQSAASFDQKKIADAEEKEKEIKKLIDRVQRINTEKQMTEAVTSQQQETIETLKADYVKIFGTLTEQIMTLENELGAIKESTQGLVQDLNNALAQKIQKIQDLEQELETLKFESDK